MKLFTWFHRKPEPSLAAAKTLRCQKCGGGIHRHDHYRILAAVHRDCGDPKQVGQKLLTKEKYGQTEADQVFSD